MRRLLFLIALGIFGCSGPGYTSQTTPTDESVSEPLDLQPIPAALEQVVTQTLPVDPAIHMGTLANGLSFMIRRNVRPENRAELRLVLNAGSILEDDDQLGLAHFVEHMAFNGTRNFEKQALIEYLESIGMRFGPDINAYTSFDETVYMLQLPTDSAHVIETGFQILRDWAGEISFDPEEIEKERGVVIEEWRRTRGAGARIRDQQLPVILHDSRYADRLPIGKPEILESFEHASLLRYYRQWYRPELMTVIAVGDFEFETIENLVTSLFSDLSNPTSAQERFYSEVPHHEEVLYTIVSDPEATSANVSVMYKHAPWAQGTKISYARRIWSSLYSSMLNQRLSELTQSVNPPYIAAGTQEGALVRTRSSYNLIALAKDGDYLQALESLLYEAERVRRFGFTETEFERVKTEYLRSMEIAFNERDKTNSSVFASEYVRHVLTGESIPGIEYEYGLVRELIPAVTLTDVNQLISVLVTEDNQVIAISGPESGTEPLPSIDEVKAVFDGISSTDLKAYDDMVNDAPLLARIPAPGTITEEVVDETVGITHMTLSNGIKLVLKPTDFKNDQVLVRATSPGGSSLADDSHYVSALFSSQLIGGSGVGSFGPIELEKKLTGKAVNIGPMVGALSEGFSGSASPRDLETLFQLIYLYGTEPRADSVVFASYMSRMSSFLSTLDASPQSAFGDTLSTTMAQYHYRSRPLSQELLKEVSLSDSFEFFKDRFSDFSDFTFYIVGAFETDSLRPFLETYLASLPATHREESWRDSGIRTPPGVVKKKVIKGLEPQSQVAIVFSGTANWSLQERRKLGFLEEVLSTRLREILREDLGGTYTVSVNGSLSDRPIESYRMTVSFGCAPDRVQELIDQVFQEVISIQNVPPDDSYIQKAREKALRDHEVSLKENGYWISMLQFYLERGMDPSAILEGPAAWVDTIDAESVSEAARKYLDTNRFVQVTLVPEVQPDS